MSKIMGMEVKPMKRCPCGEPAESIKLDGKIMTFERCRKCSARINKKIDQNLGIK